MSAVSRAPARPQQAEGIRSPHIHGEPPPAFAKTTVANPQLLWCNTKMFLLLWDKKRSPIKVTPCNSSPKDTTVPWAAGPPASVVEVPASARCAKQPQGRWMQCSLLGRELPHHHYNTWLVFFPLGYETTTTEEKHLQFWRLLGFREMAH